VRVQSLDEPLDEGGLKEKAPRDGGRRERFHAVKRPARSVKKISLKGGARTFKGMAGHKKRESKKEPTLGRGQGDKKKKILITKDPIAIKSGDPSEKAARSPGGENSIFGGVSPGKAYSLTRRGPSA